MTSAPAGIGADGVHVIRWRSVESTAVPARAPPGPDGQRPAGLDLVGEVDDDLAGPRDVERTRRRATATVIEMLGGVFSKTTSTM